jgi:hypothetical protein
MRAILTIIISVLVAGCDPGWGYHVPTPGAHTRATILPPADSGNPSLRLIRARVFSMGLHVHVAVTSAAIEGLALDSASLQVYDRDGNPLKRIGAVTGCARGYADARPPTCSLEADFSVAPLTRFFRPNPALNELTVRVEGLARDGRHIVLNLPLTWDR